MAGGRACWRVVARRAAGSSQETRFVSARAPNMHKLPPKHLTTPHHDIRGRGPVVPPCGSPCCDQAKSLIVPGWSARCLVAAPVPTIDPRNALSQPILIPCPCIKPSCVSWNWRYDSCLAIPLRAARSQASINAFSSVMVSSTA
jgi:hypothetical protein